MRLSHSKSTLILLLIFLAPAIPVTYFSHAEFAAAGDESVFHYPLVKQFASQLPHFDFSDYRAAMTPLYHVFLSVFGILSGNNLLILRSVNLLISALCIVTTYRYFSRRYSPLESLVAATTLALSPFFFGPATRLMTDNASLLLVLASLSLLDDRDYSTAGILLLSLTIACSVATRQTNIWLGPYAWLVMSRRHPARNFRERLIQSTTLILPLITLAYFVFIWKGLVPPSLYFLKPKQGHPLNEHAITFGISLVGVYGFFYLLQFRRLFQENDGRIIHVITLVILAWIFLLVFPYNFNQRFSPGPLDQVAKHIPLLFSNPFIMYLLFPYGCFVLYTVGLYSKRNKDWFIFSAFILWFIANIFYSSIYQRYFEPFIIFFIMNYAFLEKPIKPYERIGPILLILSFLSVDIVHHLFIRIS
jgi:hypothetical protein